MNPLSLYHTRSLAVTLPLLAQNHNFLGVDVGLNLTIAADRYTVTRQIDGAFHATINVKRLGAGDLALNDE